MNTTSKYAIFCSILACSPDPEVGSCVASLVNNQASVQTQNSLGGVLKIDFYKDEEAKKLGINLKSKICSAGITPLGVSKAEGPSHQESNKTAENATDKFDVKTAFWTSKHCISEAYIESLTLHLSIPGSDNYSVVELELDIVSRFQNLKKTISAASYKALAQEYASFRTRDPFEYLTPSVLGNSFLPEEAGTGEQRAIGSYEMLTANDEFALRVPNINKALITLQNEKNGHSADLAEGHETKVKKENDRLANSRDNMIDRNSGQNGRLGQWCKVPSESVTPRAESKDQENQVVCMLTRDLGAYAGTLLGVNNQVAVAAKKNIKARFQFYAKLVANLGAEQKGSETVAFSTSSPSMSNSAADALYSYEQFKTLNPYDALAYAAVAGVNSGSILPGDLETIKSSLRVISPEVFNSLYQGKTNQEIAELYADAYEEELGYWNQIQKLFLTSKTDLRLHTNFDIEDYQQFKSPAESDLAETSSSKQTKLENKGFYGSVNLNKAFGSNDPIGKDYGIVYRTKTDDAKFYPGDSGSMVSMGGFFFLAALSTVNGEDTSGGIVLDVVQPAYFMNISSSSKI